MELEKFRHDLGARNPRKDKERLWPAKDKLNKATWPRLLAGIDPEGKFGFVPNFDKWRSTDSPQLLCIQGEAGTGKTTMMIAMIENLAEVLQESTPTKFETIIGKTKPKPTLLSYFFCQRNDNRLNNIVAVLKGLIYQLISQCKDLDPTINLIQHVKHYGDAGSNIFKGPNAVYVLRNVLRDILQDVSLLKIYLLVDALDECCLGLPQLLDTITDQSYKANWLVTASGDDIIKDLGKTCVQLSIGPEQNLINVSALIDARIKDLASRQKFDPKTQEKLRNSLVEKSESSYLWVDLAFKELETGLLQAVELPNLEKELKPLYEKVMRKIMNQIEAESQLEGTPEETLIGIFEMFLHWIVISYHPLHLHGLDAIMGPRNSKYDGIKGLSDLVALWDPLLTIHQEVVYFMHQSVRDYLLSHIMDYLSSNSPLKDVDTTGGHWDIMFRCTKLMEDSMPKDKRDSASVSIMEKAASRSNENAGSIMSVKYACCYWVDHLVEALEEQKNKNVPASSEQRKFLSDGGQLHKFLQVNFLHWLVALCALKRGMDSILKLTTLASKLVSVYTRESLMSTYTNKKYLKAQGSRSISITQAYPRRKTIHSLQSIGYGRGAFPAVYFCAHVYAEDKYKDRGWQT